MVCEAVDWVMFGLVVVLFVAVVALYIFIVPSYVALLGLAAQYGSEDPCGRFGMFMVSMLMAFFVGFCNFKTLGEGRQGRKGQGRVKLKYFCFSFPHGL